LENVFRDVYGFKVQKKSIHAKHRSSPSKQIRLHIATLMLEDGNNRLLIIYYAGHGVRLAKQEELWSSECATDQRQQYPQDRPCQSSPQRTKNGENLTQLVWNEVQRGVENIEADLLVIFDSCYAGTILKAKRITSSSYPRRLTQFLGSTQSNCTAINPGPSSFTRALAWGLSHLAVESQGFSVEVLLEKIKQAPSFDLRNGSPVLSSYQFPLHEKLVIKMLISSPQSRPSDELAMKEQDLVDVKFSLDLRILLTKCPTEEHITTLSELFLDLINVKGLPFHYVLWQGLSSDPLSVHEAEPADPAQKKLSEIRRRNKGQSTHALSHNLRPYPTSGNRLQPPVVASTKEKSVWSRLCGCQAVNAAIGIVALAVGAYYFYVSYVVSEKEYHTGVWKDCHDRPVSPRITVIVIFKTDLLECRTLPIPPSVVSMQT
jgi:hypothetical protein